MADFPGTELQEKLRLLGASYIAELPDKILQLEAAWNELIQPIPKCKMCRAIDASIGS